ncbi:MAG: hypothetical protein Q9211_001696 [Gyalolechia sp. 1 TL-2023]
MLSTGTIFQSPQAPMAGTNTRQQGTRRGACDRCRGQKLRCSREGQNGTVDSTECARCAKAGAVCSFSNLLTPARQTTIVSKSSTKRKDGKDSGQMASLEAMTARDSDLSRQTDLFKRSLRDDAYDILTAECRGEEDGTSSRRPASTFNTTESPRALEAYLASDNLSTSLDFFNPLEASNMISAGKNEGFHYLNTQDPFDFQSLIQDSHLDPHQAHNIGFAARAANDDDTNGVSGHEGLGSPMTSFSNTKLGDATQITPSLSYPSDSPGRTGTAEQGAYSQLGSSDPMDYDVTHGELPRSRTRCGDTNPSSSFNPPGPLHNTRHRRLQELSDLGITFYGQILETISPAPSVNGPSALAAKVVSGSTKFLHLLTTLYSTSSSLTPSSTVDGTWDKRKSSSSIDDDVFSGDSPSSLSTDLNLTTPTHGGGGIMTGDRSSVLPVEPLSRYGHPPPSSEGNCRHKRTLSSSRPFQTAGSPEANARAEGAEAAGVEENQPADIPDVFALLTCYIRLLHLHDLLYTQVREMIITHSRAQSSAVGSSFSTQGRPSRNSSASSLASRSAIPSAPDEGAVGGIPSSLNRQRSWVPLFPGLCLDGVCLDEFARFQIKFVVQITAHTLGEIEGVLGLPEGYRVSRREGECGAEATTSNGTEAREARGWKGIFERSCVSQGFIEMTMKERGLAIERPAVGPGASIGAGDRLTRIRNHLAGLRELLKGTINP